MKTQFNSPDEFISEIAADRDKVERSIVRVTQAVAQKLKNMPHIKSVTVIATAIVEGRLVRLDRYCGDMWGMGNEHDDSVRQRASGTVEVLELALSELGMTVRPGIIIEEEGPQQ